MSETAAKPDPNKDQSRVRAGRLYLLAELLVLAVFVVALIWLMQNYRPRSFIGRGLVNSGSGHSSSLSVPWGLLGV